MTNSLLARDRAWALVTDHVSSESLRRHLLGAEAAVRGYARMWGEDEDAWGFVALVHDIDYEQFPDAENHPYKCVEWLTALGYPEWVTRAILSHADYSGVPRESRLEHTLYACDELSGFVTAAALIRPSKSVLDLEAKSVVKRMKDSGFARAVSRDDIRRGAEELGLAARRARDQRHPFHARTRRGTGTEGNRVVALLDGKVVVIIGGTTGLGLSAAKAILQAGGRVVALGREDEHLASAASALGAGSCRDRGRRERFHGGAVGDRARRRRVWRVSCAVPRRRRAAAVRSATARFTRLRTKAGAGRSI